jgi:glycosyltransferase involved in cell wall biosynthesis
VKINGLVSVVITNFNYEKYVADAINGALMQDYSPIEIIVVDDGSTDNSIEVIENYLDRITLIRKENGGVSSARNAGIMNAKGNYIAFLDADDFWEKTKIKLQIQKMQKSCTALNYCRVKFIDQQKGKETFSIESREGDLSQTFLRRASSTPFPPSSVVMTRKLVDETGKWDTTLRKAAEDYDYFRRASKLSPISYTHEALVNHREHSRSLTSGPLKGYFNDNQKAFLKALRDEEKHLSKWKRFLYTVKFQIVFMKSFVKNGDVVSFLRLLLHFGRLNDTGIVEELSPKDTRFSLLTMMKIRK